MGNTETVGLKFVAELGGGSQQVFSSMQKGLRDVAKALQATAKELLAMQRTEAADAIGHVSMAFNSLSKTLGTTGDKAKEVNSKLKLLDEGTKHFAQTSKLAQEAWAVFSKEFEKGTSSFAAAKAKAMAFDKAMSDLNLEVSIYGKTQRDVNQEISFSGIKAQVTAGNIAVLGGKFKVLKAEGYDYLLTNDKIKKSIDALHNSTNSYYTTLRNLKNISFNGVNYKAAAESMGQLYKQVKGSDTAFQKFIPNIKLVEKNLAALSTAQKTQLGTVASWTKEVDRASIVNQNMAKLMPGVTKQVELTTKGFKILSIEGLKTFGSLSLDTASKLGMLDKNFGSFMSSMRIVQSTTGKTKDEIAKLAASMLKSNTTFEGAAIAAKKYISTMDGMAKVGEGVNLLSIKYRDLLKATDSYGVSARKLIATINNEPEKLKIIAAELRNVNLARNKEVTATESLRTAYLSLSSQYERLLNAENRQGEAARKVIESLKEKGASASVVRSKLVALNNEMGNLDNMTNRLVRSFKTYSMYMISSSILRGVTESFRSGASAIIEYDQTIQDLKAITEGSVKEIGQMDSALLQTTSTSKYSAKETGEAMRQLGQAGLEATEIAATIPGIANLATGAAESLKTTVDLISTTLKVFELNVNETSRVTDIFANAVVKSRLKIEGLNTAFNYIGPVARQAGLSLEETSAGLMVLANSGLKASTQATGFRQVLSGLMSPSKNFAKAIEMAGFSVEEFSPLMNSFESILSKLPKVVTNSKDALEMFGIRGGAAISAFVNQGSGQFVKMTNLLKESGSAARMSSTQMEGLANILANLKNKFDVLAITLGKAGLADIFKGIALEMAAMLESMNKFAQTPSGALGMQMTALAGAFTALGTAVSLFWPLISKIGAAFTSFTGSIATVAAGLGGPLTIALGVVAAAVTSGIFLWQKYKLEMEASIDAKTKEIDALSAVSKNLEAYNLAVKTYGKYSDEANKAALVLRQSVLDVGKSSKDSKYFIDEFAGSIDQTTGKIKYQKQYVEDLTVALNDKLGKVYTDLAAKSLKFYNSKNGFANWFYDVKRSYEALVVAVQNGNSQAKKALTDIDNAAKDIVARYGEMKDVTHLSSTEIKELAKHISDLVAIGPEMEGALVNQLIRVQEESAKTKTSQAEMVDGIVKSYGDLGVTVAGSLEMVRAQMQQTISAENKSLDMTASKLEENYQKKVTILDRGITYVKKAVEREIQVERDKHQSYSEMLDTTEEETQISKEKLGKKILEIQKEGLSAEKKILEMQLIAFKKVYADELKNVEDFYKRKLFLEEESYKSEQYRLDDSLKKKIVAYEKSTMDEAKVKKLSLEANIDYYKQSMNAADNHYTKMSDLYDREFKARTSSAPTIIEGEKKTQKEIKAIQEDLLKNQKQALETRKSLYISTLDVLRSKELELTNAAKAEAEKRKSFDQSTEEWLRELSYKTLSSREVEEKKFEVARKAASDARKLYLAGEFELAQKKGTEAIEAFKSVEGGLKDNSTSVGEYAQKVGSLGDEVKGVQTIWDDSSKKLEKNLKSQATDVGTFANDVESKLQVMEKKLKDILVDFSKVGAQKIEISIEDAVNNLNTLNAKIAEVTKQQALVAVKIDPESSTALQNLKDVLDGVVKQSEEPVVVKMEGEASERKPLIEKLTEIKEKLKDTFTFDELMTDIVLSIKADSGSGPSAVGPVFESVKQALSEISQFLTDLSAIPTELKIEVMNNQELLDLLDSIKNKLDELAKGWKVNLEIDVFGLDELQSAWDTWNNFVNSPDSVTKTVNVKENVSRNVDVTTSNEGHAVGSRIPGYGGGDTVNARLEPGEWVIRKEAVRKYGDTFMAMVNQMNLPIKKFAAGGSVYSSPSASGKDTWRIDTTTEKGKTEIGQQTINVYSKDPKGGYTGVTSEKALSGYASSGDIKDLYKSINDIAKTIAEDSQYMASWSKLGATGGQFATIAPSTAFSYNSSGTEAPDMQNLNIMISNLSKMVSAGMGGQAAYNNLNSLKALSGAMGGDTSGLDAEALAKIAETKKKAAEDELKAIEDQKKAYEDLYQSELEDVQNSYTNQMKLIDEKFTAEKDRSTEVLNSRLEDIAKLDENETTKRALSIAATIDYYKNSIDATAAHLDKMQSMQDKANDAQLSAIPDLYENEKDSNAKIEELRYTSLENQKESLDARKDSYQEAIDAMESMEKSLTEAIDNEISKREDFQKSMGDIYTELSQKNFTESQMREVRLTDAKEKATKARILLTKGEFEAAQEASVLAIEAFKNVEADLDSNAEAAKNYAESIKSIQDNLKEVENSRSESLAKENAKYQKDLDDLRTNKKESAAKIDTKLTEDLNSAEKDKVKGLADLESKHIKDLSKANESRIKTIVDLETDHQKNIAKLEEERISSVKSIEDSSKAKIEELTVQLRASLDESARIRSDFDKQKKDLNKDLVVGSNVGSTEREAKYKEYQDKIKALEADRQAKDAPNVETQGKLKDDMDKAAAERKAALEENTKAYSDSLIEIEKALAENIFEANTSYSSTVNDLQTSYTADIADSVTSFNEKVSELNAARATDLAENEKNYSASVADLEASHAASLAESASEYAQTVADLSAQIEEVRKSWEESGVGPDGTAAYSAQISALADQLKGMEKIWMESSAGIESGLNSQKVVVGDYTEELVIGMEGVDAQIQTVISSMTSLNASSLASSLGEMAKLSAALDDITAKKSEVDALIASLNNLSSATGSSTLPGHADGARIPGYGGGDTVDARLEPGEWIIRKEAVKKYGNSFMSMVNQMQLPKMQFRNGGSIDGFHSFHPSAASSVQRGARAVTAPQGPSHTVHFNIGGEVHGPFSASGATAESFVKTLKIHQMRS
jgi:TP901 family phage tail tape measure protein